MSRLKMFHHALTALLLGLGSANITAQPVELLPGETETATLSDAQDVIWWQISTVSDGSLTLVAVSDSTIDVDMYLYDNIDGTYPVASGTDAGTNETVTCHNLMSGTYYVKTTRAIPSGAGIYIITADFTPTSLENDPEDNDTPSVAGLLAYNGTDTGHLGFHSQGSDDIDDYWAVKVPADGSLRVSTVSDSTLDVDLYLLDTDGETVIAGYDISTGIEEATHYDALTPGTYFIKAGMYGDTYGSYTITSQFSPTSGLNDAEPNNDVVSAVFIDNLSTLSGHLGHYDGGALDDDDYFAVTVPIEWDTLYVHLVSDTALDIDIVVYGAGGVTQVASGEHRGTDEWVGRTNLAESVYYVKMHRWSGYGSYEFVVSNSTAARPGDEVNGVAEDLSAPEAYRLAVPYPNPFNPATTIPYTLASDGRVRIVVYDMLGREVAVLVDEYMPQGEHSTVWNARDHNGRSVGNGVYLFRLEAGGHVWTQRGTLVK